MSTVVCQGLQSYLESQVVETTTLRLKLAAPKPVGLACMLESDTKKVTEKCQYEDTNKSSNLDLGGWSFLQDLSNTSQNPQESMDRESPYVHPSVKRSLSPKLSEKSLELCTENLGSETGTDIIESSIFSVSSPDSPKKEQQKLGQQMESRKVSSRNFPPPLTSISGSNPLKVRPHREDGRLIIKVMEAPSTHTFLQAERSNGRLRLSFFNNHASNFEGDCTEDHEISKFENNANNEEKQEEEEEEGEGEELEEEEEDEEESDAYMSKELDGNILDVEVEMGMEKFQRPSRCKEGGHGHDEQRCWEPFLVATS